MWEGEGEGEGGFIKDMSDTGDTSQTPLEKKKEEEEEEVKSKGRCFLYLKD